jgi:hypothetical protein
MALYALRKLFHSNELSPLQSLCRKSSRGSIISLYWSLRRLTHLGSNLPGLLPTRHCDMLPGKSVPGTRCDARADASKQRSKSVPKSVPGTRCDARSDASNKVPDSCQAPGATLSSMLNKTRSTNQPTSA